jgi:hypothetical protein
MLHDMVLLSWNFLRKKIITGAEDLKQQAGNSHQGSFNETCCFLPVLSLPKHRFINP